MFGNPISVSMRPGLTAHRGKLLSGQPLRGKAVHAASFIRRREIVLELELLEKPDFPLILAHELFHFVWARLGNRKRAAYAALLNEERKAGARGELGESAGMAKQTGRDYACESFCDTAAWLFVRPKHFEHATLAERWSARRRAWFERNLEEPLAC